jgi:hypothetical protein
MPPQVIVSPQFGFGKSEQFTPELIWQKMVSRVIVPAHLIGGTAKNADCET